jgi:hypothetical protein
MPRRSWGSTPGSNSPDWRQHEKRNEIFCPEIYPQRVIEVQFNTAFLHGGEASNAKVGYAALRLIQKNQLRAFLCTLRNPDASNADVQGIFD